MMGQTPLLKQLKDSLVLVILSMMVMLPCSAKGIVLYMLNFGSLHMKIRVSTY